MSSPGTPDWKAQEAPPLLKECPVKREESWPHVRMTLRKVLTKTDLVSHFVLPLSKNTNAGMCKCGGAKKARAEVCETDSDHWWQNGETNERKPSHSGYQLTSNAMESLPQCNVLIEAS